MNVYLGENGTGLIPGDLILRWLLRSDLAPVPRSIEMTIRVKDDLQQRLAVGKTFYTGSEMLKYEVVKAQRKTTGEVQGGDAMAAIEVTALLASCVRVSYRAGRAIIKDSARLGEIYRACGADAIVDDDFVVSRFCCLAGDVPSFWLATAMQEEASCLVMRNGRLKILRLQDLFRQESKGEIIQENTTDSIESEFLERHEIPAFFSTADDNSPVFGDFSKSRQIRFMPRANERQLRNASRVLVLRQKVVNQFTEDVVAGDILTVNGNDYAVITAAHLMKQADGAVDSQSVFWVGDLSA